MVAVAKPHKRKVCPSCGYALGPGAYQRRGQSCDSCLNDLNRIRPWEAADIERLIVAAKAVLPLWALYQDMWREPEHAVFRELINAIDRRKARDGW